MKVLAVFPPLHDENAGGIQVAGLIAWEALQSRGATRLEVSARRRWRAVRMARALPNHYDVILFWHLDLLRLAPLISRTARRVVFLHGIEAWRRPDAFTRLLLRRAVLWANSQYTADRARTTLRNREPARIIHLGLGTAARECQTPADPPVALMISRLDAGERYKGHHEVIDAWTLVQERVPQAQLWIIGDGDLRAELEARANGRNIRFFGRVSDAEKQTLIDAACCVVLPSRGEGFGLVYLEAMRSGRPCLIGTDAGREVVHPPEAGLSVDPADHAALADALVRLLSRDAEWQRMADGARRRHADNFTAAHFQQRLLSALDGLA
jgi:phosphatidylinositol alpha-1,6-mannosyltransferase